MDFLHQQLLKARTKDQEDKIVNWMLAEARRNQPLKSFSKENNKQSDLKI